MVCPWVNESILIKKINKNKNKKTIMHFAYIHNQSQSKYNINDMNYRHNQPKLINYT